MLVSIHFCELHGRLTYVSFRIKDGAYYAKDEVSQRVLARGQNLAELRKELKHKGCTHLRKAITKESRGGQNP